MKTHTDAELQREFASIASSLGDTSTSYSELDWNERMNALKRMQGLIAGGASDFESFPALFLRFVGPLSVQLNDLRSAVVKQAVKTAVMAAQACSSSFELCAERLSDVLFKLMNSGTKIIAQAGNQCLTEIVNSVITWRFIPKIAEHISSRNPNIRSKAAQCLQLILETYPQSAYEQTRVNLNQHMESAIRSAVHDASPQARAAGRKSYNAYLQIAPERARRLYSQFDISVQKAIGDDSTPGKMQSRSNSANKFKRAMKQPQPRKEYSKTTESFAKPVQKEKMFSSMDLVEDMSCTGGSANIPEVPRPRKQVPPSPVSKLEFVIEKSHNENWSTRFNAFERLGKALAEEESINILVQNPTVWEGVLGTLVDHMLDPHIKVQLSVFGALKLLIEILPQKVSFALEKILPKLVTCLGENKENLVLETMEVFQLVIDIYIPEDLLTLLMRYPLTQLKARARPKLLQIYFQLGDTSTEYLDRPSNVSPFIQKVVGILGECTLKNQYISVLKILQSTYRKNKNATIQAVNELNSHDHGVVRKILQEFDSPLQKEFRPVKAPVKQPVYQTSKEQTRESIREPIRQPIKEAPREPVIESVKQPPKESFRPPIRETQQSRPSIQKPQMPTRPQSYSQPKPEPRPEASSNLISSLISQCRNPGVVRYDALKRIQQMNQQNHPSFLQSFSEVLQVSLTCIQDDTLHIRTYALQVIKDLFRRQAARIRPYLANCVSELTKGFQVQDRHTFQGTEQALQELINSQDVLALVPMFLEFIAKQELPVTQALIRQITKSVKKMSIGELRSTMRAVMNQLKQSFNHHNADVRKSVVFCLVEIQAILGDEFDSYLEELSPSQQKLVTIYVQRRLLNN